MSGVASNPRVAGPGRWSIGAALIATAASHLPVIAVHLREAPYLGVSFVVFTMLAVGLAVGVMMRGSRGWLLAAATLCAAALGTYCATRLVAFPQLGDDVGNWREPAGVAAAVSEMTALALIAYGLRRQPALPYRVSRPLHAVSGRLAAGTAIALGLASVVVIPAVAASPHNKTMSLAASAFNTTATSGTPTLAKFTEQLTVPPTVDLTAGGAVTLAMRGGMHQFSAGLPSTPTLGYIRDGLSSPDIYGGPTLIAHRDHPVTVTVKNQLGAHPLASSMDSTLMGMQTTDANMPRGTLHLHGAHDAAAMDGLPASTFLPTNQFSYTYGNDQAATGLWYHDHAWGMTRLQVTAGLAGQYWLRDNYDTGTASNPLGLPSGANEIPLTLQDRTFNADGTFSYPVGAFTAPYPVGYPHNWAPESFGDTAIVNGKAFPNLNVNRGLYRFRVLNASNARFYNLSFDTGATFYQIGSDGGLLDRPVPLTSLRLAPAERADLLIDFRNYPPGTQLQLTNDAVAPYPSGARAAVRGGNPLHQIMQFTTTSASGNATSLPSTLRGGSGQPLTLPTLHPTNTRTIMLNEIEDPAQPVHVMTNNQFYADSSGKPRTSGIENPALNSVEEWDIVNTTQDAHPIHLHLTQFRLLNRQAFDVSGYVAAVNRQLTINGTAGPGLPDPSAAGSGPRPEVSAAAFLQSTPTTAAANESGWKDTIVAMPGYVTRIIVPFGGTAANIPAPFTGDAPGATVQQFTGTYVLHCHILEHEDNDMMQPYKIS